MGLNIAPQDHYQQRIADLKWKIAFVATAITDALNTGDDEELGCLKTQKGVLEIELEQINARAEESAAYTDGDPDDTLGGRAMP